eukprot:GHRR01010142.1.p2 GENE.GHRR01010142.1~~GHRR01010142.1.p2  ORF type:complete len:124 (+),score=54.43 GHRR01010142.1:1031-1402(+)
MCRYSVEASSGNLMPFEAYVTVARAAASISHAQLPAAVRRSIIRQTAFAALSSGLGSMFAELLFAGETASTLLTGPLSKQQLRSMLLRLNSACAHQRQQQANRTSRRTAASGCMQQIKHRDSK